MPQGQAWHIPGTQHKQVLVVQSVSKATTVPPKDVQAYCAGGKTKGPRPASYSSRGWQEVAYHNSPPVQRSITR